MLINERILNDMKSKYTYINQFGEIYAFVCESDREQVLSFMYDTYLNKYVNK